jgi:hypothetical protein
LNLIVNPGAHKALDTKLTLGILIKKEISAAPVTIALDQEGFLLLHEDVDLQT